MLNIVLVEPEIPQNTGNIARTCAATNTALHLVRPLGFEIDDKKLKRAGLDYWHLLNITYYKSIDEFLSIHCDKELYFFSTKSKKVYSDVNYSKNSFLIFGKETKGLDEQLLLKYRQQNVRIPMVDDARSLNLSNSVAVALYEALRQQNFFGLKTQGQFHTIKE
jgi:tRNA (cytidine/uridine-2'-O-)-methyltransferase